VSAVGFISSGITQNVAGWIGTNLPYANSMAGVYNVAAHGLLGGAMAELQGGNFGHGFISSAISTSIKSVMTPQQGSYSAAVGRTMISAIVGGTMSHLTGGSFANGAITSALQWWFNAEDSGKFLNADLSKAQVEVELGKILKAKLSSGKIEIEADLKPIRLKIDHKGNISFSGGIVKGTSEFNGIETELKMLGIDAAGFNLEFSGFNKDSISFKAYYSNEFMGYDVGQYFTEFSGNIQVNPRYYLLKSETFGEAANMHNNAYKRTQEALKAAGVQ
jgi:hypothetical protein